LDYKGKKSGSPVIFESGIKKTNLKTRPFRCIIYLEDIQGGLMKRTLGMILKFLATGTITLFLAACYGLMMEWKRITAKTVAGSPISGLKVTLLDSNGTDELAYDYTDANGFAEIRYFYTLDGLPFKIEDVYNIPPLYQTYNGSFNAADEYEIPIITLP
jgi:hypothetical protein